MESISILAAKYRGLGAALGLKGSALDKITSENPNNNIEALREVIKMWLSGADLVKGKQSVIPSWKTLAIAVAHSAGGSNPALAKQIATKHPGILGFHAMNFSTDYTYYRPRIRIINTFIVTSFVYFLLYSKNDKKRETRSSGSRGKG
jgi:hypothetical protein